MNSNLKNPKVSVVMSVYNGEKYLREAVESILNQTLTDFEFIIINDGSTDNSTNIVQSYSDKRIVFLQQENKGLAKSLNRGIIKGRGEYVARMDADDISHPERLERQIEFLENNPKHVLVGTNAIVIDENGCELFKSDLPSKDDELREAIRIDNPERFYGSPFFHSSVMFRKKIAIEEGIYEEKVFHYIEDILLWIKLSKRGYLANLSEYLLTYRLVPEGIGCVDFRDKRKVRKILSVWIRTGQLSVMDQLFLSDLSKRTTKAKRLSVYNFKVGQARMCAKGNNSSAFKYFLRSLLYYPFYCKGWLYLVVSLMPYSLINYLKGIRKSLLR